MSTGLKYTFLIHILVAALFGFPLLLFPGLFLGLFGWAPVDPLLSRVLGAALLAHAWSSFRVLRGSNQATVAVLLETEIVFMVLSGIGMLRHLLIANYPLMMWLVFALFVAFAVAWTILLFSQSKRQTSRACMQTLAGAVAGTSADPCARTASNVIRVCKHALVQRKVDRP